MAQRTRRFRLGGGTAIALLGAALLIASFAMLIGAPGSGTLAINAPPLLFISAVIALRIGVVMSERYLCSACGERVALTSTQCPGCDEPLYG